MSVYSSGTEKFECNRPKVKVGFVIDCCSRKRKSLVVLNLILIRCKWRRSWASREGEKILWWKIFIYLVAVTAVNAVMNFVQVHYKLHTVEAEPQDLVMRAKNDYLGLGCVSVFL